MQHVREWVLWLSTEGQFWVATIGGGLLKLRLSDKLTVPEAIATLATAIFAAYIATDPTLRALNLSAETWTEVVAVLWALTGEGVARGVLAMTKDRQAIMETLQAVLRLWRGK